MLEAPPNSTGFVLLQELKIVTIVETGTFRGTTTDYMAKAGLPVFSCELHPRYFHYSSLRLAKIPNIRLGRADSRPEVVPVPPPAAASPLKHADDLLTQGQYDAADKEYQAQEAAAGPALWAQLDLGEIDQALAKLSPIDAVRGALAAEAYAAHLLYGPLLRNAGPLTMTGTVAAKNAAEIEIRLPLR